MATARRNTLPIDRGIISRPDLSHALKVAASKPCKANRDNLAEGAHPINCVVRLQGIVTVAADSNSSTMKGPSEAQYAAILARLVAKHPQMRASLVAAAKSTVPADPEALAVVDKAVKHLYWEKASEKHGAVSGSVVVTVLEG